MKKKIIILLLTLIIPTTIITGCNNNKSEETIISNFINKKMELYSYPNDLPNFFTVITLDNDVSTTNSSDNDNSSESFKVAQDIMNELKSYMSEKTFDRLLSNAVLLDRDMFLGLYNKAEIDNMSFEEISRSDSEVIYNVKYIKRMFIDDEKVDIKECNFDFTLKKDDAGNWEIYNITNHAL